MDVASIVTLCGLVLSAASAAPPADATDMLPPSQAPTMPELIAAPQPDAEAQATPRPRLLAPVVEQPKRPASAFTSWGNNQGGALFSTSEQDAVQVEGYSADGHGGACTTGSCGPEGCCCFNCLPTPLPRISFRHDFGEGVGFDHGFTSVEALIPVWRFGISETFRGHTKVLFADVRAVNFDDSDRWEFNLGAVERRFVPEWHCVIGWNAFYDHRHTESNTFQQVGVGTEVLGKIFEFRCNGYVILGPDRRLVSDTGFVNNGVVNGNFVLNRNQTYEVARGGIEAEVGAALPYFGPIYPRAYVGVYSYAQDKGIQTATGIRGRLEAQVGQRLSLHVAVQNDAVFDTTVTAGVGIHFGAPAFRSTNNLPTWTDVLGQRVHRDINIVISQEAVDTTALVPAPAPAPIVR